MARSFDTVFDINDKKELWKVAVKVHHRWIYDNEAVCLDTCKKLHEMGAFTDMLLPDKGSGGEKEKAEQNNEEDALPGAARYRELYPVGVADILKP